MNNILVSGWPGSGSSALTIILTKLFEYKLLRGTETFRHIWKKLNLSKTGQENIDAERMIQPFFGKVYDKYIDSKIPSPQGVVIDSDIGGFRIGKSEKFFSIFLAPKREIRFERLAQDSRSEEIKFLIEREEELRERYRELHNIDWFSLEEINSKYSISVDNSEISIAQEVILILDKMFEANFIEKEKYEKLKIEVPQLEVAFWKYGKTGFVEKFFKPGQLIDVEDILKEISSIYSDEVELFPEVLRKIVKVD